MAKRPLEVEEFEGVSAVLGTSPSAKIHGVVTSVSPMKKSRTSCNYFDGEITDGKTSMRLFGFDAAAGVRRRLVEFEEKEQPVVLTKCEVKHSREGSQLEILVGKYTDVDKSEKSFEVESVPAKKIGKKMVLKELGDLVQFQRITVSVKAIRVQEPTEVAGGKKKQDILVGDSTATARLTIWEKEIGKMEEGKSYQLCGMVVREYRGTKFLSTSKENSQIEPIDDVGAVEEEEEDSEESGKNSHVKNARIVGVLDLESYRVCMKCKGKVVLDEDDEELGECIKCKMVQCVDGSKSHLTTRVIIAAGKEHLTLRAFGKTVLQLFEKSAEDEVTERVLLKAKVFSFVQQDGIIQSVSRRV